MRISHFAFHSLKTRSTCEYANMKSGKYRKIIRIIPSFSVIAIRNFCRILLKDDNDAIFIAIFLVAHFKFKQSKNWTNWKGLYFVNKIPKLVWYRLDGIYQGTLRVQTIPNSHFEMRCRIAYLRNLCCIDFWSSFIADHGFIATIGLFLGSFLHIHWYHFIHNLSMTKRYN